GGPGPRRAGDLLGGASGRPALLADRAAVQPVGAAARWIPCELLPPAHRRRQRRTRTRRRDPRRGLMPRSHRLCAAGAAILALLAFGMGLLLGASAAGFDL